jgi:hypothetical protein
MRRQAIGDSLSAKEMREKWELDLFYNVAYVPLRRLIQDAEAAGESTEQYRTDMQQAADAPRSMLTSPPESLAPYVAAYKQNAVYLAGFTPDRDDYKTDETYEQKVSSIKAAETSLKEAGISYEEAQSSLVDYFRRDGGRETQRNTLKDAYVDRARKLDELYGKPKFEYRKWRAASGNAR